MRTVPKTYLLLSYCIIALATPTLAQNTLKQQFDRYLKMPLSLRQRVDSINALTYKTFRSDYDLAIAMAAKAQQLSAAGKYEEGETIALVNLAEGEEGQGNFIAAQNHMIKAIAMLERKGPSKLLGEAYAGMGWLQRRFFKRGEAMDYTLKGLKMAEKVGDKLTIARCYNTIAILHTEQKSYDLALQYHRKALAVRQQIHDTLGISMSLGNMGIVYNKMKAYDKSIAHHQQSLAVLKGDKYKAREAFIYNDLGAVSLRKGNLDDAVRYLKKSIAMREQMNELSELAYTYNYLGETYNAKHDFKQAEYWIKKALATAVAIKNTKQNYEALESLSDFYANNNRHDSAYAYLHQHKLYGDSVKQIEKANQVRELTTRYETEKKEQQIEILQQQNTLQQLQIRQRNIYLIASVIFILLAAAAGYLFYTRRKAQQQVHLQQEINRQQDITAREILNAEERERQRMATDLHDGVGQLLSAALMGLNQMAIQNVNDKMVDKSLALVTESYDEIRSISHQIIPNALLKYGLAAAVRDMLNKIDERLIKISLETAGINDRLDEQVETILYRVIQESVNNVIKHAAASELSIQLVKDDEGINLTIEDNGKGFDTTQLKKDAGIGIKNIGSRVSFLKGTVDIESSPGEGTLVVIFIPA